MQVLAPGFAHARPSAQPPIDTSGNCACVCKISFKHLLQPLISHIQSNETLGQLLKIPPFSAQNWHSAGGKGGP